MTEAKAPSLFQPRDWHPVHVGPVGDDFELGGLRLWDVDWREQPDAPLMLAHPAHPGQMHEFRVYQIDQGVRGARFAAAELPNRIFAFYCWVVPADPPAGTSADGSLRFEHDLGPCLAGRYDAMTPVARLYDARSGELLLDGAGWWSSRVVPQADGSVLVALDKNQLQTLFHIDPPARRFRDLATTEPFRPLHELALATAAARAACDDPANAYSGRAVAPDGSLRVELAAAEWSNSHWVNSPRVIETATGRILLDLWNTDWDASASFPRHRMVHLSLRRYHHGGGAEADIDLAAERYTVFEDSGQSSGPLSGLPEALEQASRREVAKLPPRTVIPPPRPTARSWLVALAILVGALVAIAGATTVTLALRPPPPARKLDTIPPMPKFPERNSHSGDFLKQTFHKQSDSREI